jgi:hypothetical protein
MILTTGMAVTVTWTQADVDKLKAAIASGALTVSYAGPPARLITYQSLTAMREALASIVRQANATPTFRRVSFSKGFDSGNGNG